MKPINHAPLIGRNAYVHVSFDAEVPEGTKIEDVYEATLLEPADRR